MYTRRFHFPPPRPRQETSPPPRPRQEKMYTRRFQPFDAYQAGAPSNLLEHNVRKLERKKQDQNRRNPPPRVLPLPLFTSRFPTQWEHKHFLKMRDPNHFLHIHYFLTGSGYIQTNPHRPLLRRPKQIATIPVAICLQLLRFPRHVLGQLPYNRPFPRPIPIAPNTKYEMHGQKNVYTH